MIVLIDTSSLLAFVRYYLPFDKNQKIKSLFHEKYESGDLVILNKVFEEAKFIAQGIILKELDFILDKTKHVKTDNLLPDKRFFNLLENQFCNKDVVRLRGITEVEFEQEKTRYLGNADAAILLYALKRKSENPLIVTEESRSSNDGKIFKKIPDNCKELQINCCSLPTLLRDHLNIDLGKLIG
jgi:hypothetical protein